MIPKLLFLVGHKEIRGQHRAFGLRPIAKPQQDKVESSAPLQSTLLETIRIKLPHPKREYDTLFLRTGQSTSLSDML
jgi:hypothetical protein